jgi:hypothetical protein
MAATVEDHDYPKRAAHKLGVSEDVALALESHVDQYADMKDERTSTLRPLIRGIRRHGI